jgi:hypothetical protein
MTHAVLDYEDLTARYRRMRKVGFELNKILPRYVSKEGLEATARKLGIWRKGTLVFDDVDQASVLFDQAIHGYFTDGRNAVDHYFADHPPEPESDQEALLAASKRSFYSLFQVESIVPQVGVHVDDILRDRRHFMADVGFGQTAVKGLVLATRVLPFENFLMTSGAPLPLDADTLANIFRLPALNKPSQDIEGMSKQEMADVAAAIIHLCLKGNSSRGISCLGLDEAAQRDDTPRAGEPRVGRNDPCPCGSGRKYKKCCGK